MTSNNNLNLQYTKQKLSEEIQALFQIRSHLATKVIVEEKLIEDIM